MSSNSPPRLPMRELKINAFKNTSDRIMIETVVATEAYRNCEDYREQCHILNYFLSAHGWSQNKISTLLDIDHKSFERQIKAPILSNPNGRPPVLNNEEKLNLFSAIEYFHNCNIHPTLYDLQQFIITNIQKVISVQTIHNYIKQSKKFKIIEGIPMHDKRCSINEDDLNTYFEQLKVAVNGTPVSLIYNMDEAGEDEYVDSFSMMVIVPISYDKSTIPLPVRRQSKRSTLVHCICADGTYLKPLVIIPRKTVDSSTFKRLNCNNLLIKHQEKGFANTDIIKIWLEQIFFPNIEKKLQEEKERSGFDGKAVLILDGCSCHAAALKQYNLDEKKLTLIYLVPHSSHITQPLDLVSFALQKKFTYGRRLSTKIGEQADKLRMIIRGMQESSSSDNITASFESAGIFRDYSSIPKKNFNEMMPIGIVVKEGCRYYKMKDFSLPDVNFRVEI